MNAFNSLSVKYGFADDLETSVEITMPPTTQLALISGEAAFVGVAGVNQCFGVMRRTLTTPVAPPACQVKK
jgi:hypothetical protein